MNKTKFFCGQGQLVDDEIYCLLNSAREQKDPFSRASINRCSTASPDKSCEEAGKKCKLTSPGYPVSKNLSPIHRMGLVWEGSMCHDCGETAACEVKHAGSTMIITPIQNTILDEASMETSVSSWN